MRVIIFLLKCVVGILATVGLFIVGGIALLVFLTTDVSKVAELTGEEAPAQQKLLTIDLADGLVERSSQDKLLQALQLQGRPIILSDAVAAIERAAGDPEVEGIVAHLGRGNAGTAQIQELRTAIQKFRNSGKPAFAFAETFGEAGSGMAHYYLASAFEEVWVQPSATFDVTGYRFSQPYIKDLLDEIGIAPRIQQRKEYKGVASVFLESEQPDPVAENLGQVVNSLLDQSVSDIALSRGLSPSAVRSAIDRGPLLASEARSAGLVDGLTYWDVFLDAVDARLSPDYVMTPLQDYAANTKPTPEESGASIAFISASGGIVLGPADESPFDGDSGQIASDWLADALSSAIEDASIQAIVLRIDSPGGSYVASDAIWREVKRAGDEGKPVIVSMGNVAASGGYFIAAPAEQIVAQPGTLTGSIGVAGGKFVIEGLMDEIGVSIGSVGAGANSGFYALDEDFTPEQEAILTKHLDAVYEDFTAKVAEGRGLSREAVEAVAGGRIWTGQDALERGLVDALGGVETAVGLARTAAGIDPNATIDLRPWPEPEDPWKKLFENFSNAPFASLARIEAALGAWVQLAEEMNREPRSTLLLDRRLEHIEQK
jgi:protease-4